MATRDGPKKINLGCGPKLIQGWMNVDLHQKYGNDFFKTYGPIDDTQFRSIDLSKTPWDIPDSYYQHLVALDFLEHFPYRQTGTILSEMWRVMEVGGLIELQVPDFTECARAAMGVRPFFCHTCGFVFTTEEGHQYHLEIEGCPKCKTTYHEITKAAIHRLYGGQDFVGNWHYNAFTKDYLRVLMTNAGFHSFELVERNENGETFAQNWNFKIRARKGDGW